MTSLTYNIERCHPAFLEKRFCFYGPLIATSEIQDGQKAGFMQKTSTARPAGTWTHCIPSSLQSVTRTRNVSHKRKRVSRFSSLQCQLPKKNAKTTTALDIFINHMWAIQFGNPKKIPGKWYHLREVYFLEVRGRGGRSDANKRGKGSYDKH